MALSQANKRKAVIRQDFEATSGFSREMLVLVTGCGVVEPRATWTSWLSLLWPKPSWEHKTVQAGLEILGRADLFRVHYRNRLPPSTLTEIKLSHTMSALLTLVLFWLAAFIPDADLNPETEFLPKDCVIWPASDWVLMRARSDA